MKVAHVALGLAWLVSVLLFSTNPAIGRRALLVSSALSLWYLPFGTIASIALLLLLLLPRFRNGS